VRFDHVASFIVNANHSIIASEIKPAEHWEMKARLVKFGEIEVEGKRYTHDVVIDRGKVRKRKKGPSKQFREKFGHTPLSAGEEIPWGGKRLIVGTGAHGALPVMDEVLAEAKRRGIEVIAAPTLEVCQLLEEVKKGQAYAILHCTCWPEILVGNQIDTTSIFTRSNLVNVITHDILMILRSSRATDLIDQ
jgi:hypothetical protein